MYFFFFQAEDGIRDLVRSRGLGDVYKRQLSPRDAAIKAMQEVSGALVAIVLVLCAVFIPVASVSYTHLTLPTSDLV